MKTFKKLKLLIETLSVANPSQQSSDEEEITNSIAINNITLLANTIELEIDSVKYEQK